MNIFRFFILIFVFTITSAKADEMIGLEVKEYDNVDAFILYHPDYFKIEVSYVGQEVKIIADYPIDIRKLTPVSINQLSGNIKKTNNKTITFHTKEPYSNYEIVKGERLTAIKFKTEKKFEKTLHPIQALNKQDHHIQGMKVEEQEPEKVEQAKIKVTENEIEIKFDFAIKVNAAAYRRNDKLWIGFDKKQDFTFPENQKIKSPRYIDVKGCTVFSLDIPSGYDVGSFSTSNEDWIVKFYKNKKPEEKTSLVIDKLLDKYGLNIANNDFGQIINYIDPDIGDNISLITSANSKKLVQKSQDYVDFILSKTITGIAVIWVSDEHNINFTKNGIEIYSLLNPSLASQFDEKIDYSKSSLPLYFNIPKDMDFIGARSYFYNKVALSDKKNLNENKYNLSAFFFKESMIQEAIGALNIIETDAGFLEKFPASPLYKAVLLSLSKDYYSSEKILSILLKNEISPLLQAEATIWSNYNNVMLGSKADSIGVLEFIDKFINEYPDYIYWKLLFAELELASDNNDLSTLDQIFRKVREVSQQDHIDLMNYYKATFYRKNKKFNLANNYYDAIKQNDKDNSCFVKSELDQTDMLLKQEQIELDEAINRLQKLKFLWRGDELEYDVLLKLAQLEQEKLDYINALRAYKYILDAFPESKGSVHISNQMADIYNNFIFSKGGIYESLPDFELVSLYYEFKELTPLGSDGDKVVLLVAKRLINLDLLEQAEKILNHQVRYRLTGRDKIISGDHLAAVYILNKKPKLAVEILDETDLSNFGFLEHIIRQRIKAKALIDMGRYNDAVITLSQDDSTEAKIIKQEAYFQKGDWENFAISAESSILPLLEIQKTIPTTLEKEALRLAIAYSMLGKIEELNYLNNEIKTNNKILHDSINLIVSSNGKIDLKTLDSKFDVDEVDKYFKSIIDKLFSFK